MLESKDKIKLEETKEKNIKPGLKVKLKTANDSFEGIIIPSPEEETILLKLGSGYNVGFKTEDVIEIVEIKESKESQKNNTDKKESNNLKSVSNTKNESLPTIVILHTGGTIASKVDYRTGAVASNFSPEELLSMFPELGKIANIESELVAQMWSDDLRFSHLSLIGKTIEKWAAKKPKGMIIGMGTDNLAAAAAGLSFIVEKINIPIIFVGAQRSSDRGSSDASMNLICAAEFIAKTEFTGVAICMHSSENDEWCNILPANKTYKLHSSRRDAFQAVNSEAIAKINYLTKEIKFISKNYPLKETELLIKTKMEEKVALLKIHPNMFPEQFSIFKNFKGLVIEGTGLGHTPGQVPNPLCEIHRKIYPAIKEVMDSGCVIVMTTQCLFGGVNMNVYDKGRDLLDLGIIPGQDMLANTALMKLSWLLGNYTADETKKMMKVNLRGEINEKLQFEEEFLK
ncbi:Glu-tRNA(Gln) amidotransferase subunit GatD [Candidatus Woesearchaeota archaeon]|nr:hypothetical protein [uncultured archaeon]MBS3123763.1 Glu-tRNA(Gln) amidotransferase subunit GatD [Candidatus Woesearchaeota archaeon]